MNGGRGGLKTFENAPGLTGLFRPFGWFVLAPSITDSSEAARTSSLGTRRAPAKDERPGRKVNDGGLGVPLSIEEKVKEVARGWAGRKRGWGTVVED